MLPQWLDKDGLLITHVLRHSMQVFKRQRQIFGKGPVEPNDPQNVRRAQRMASTYVQILPARWKTHCARGPFLGSLGSTGLCRKLTLPLENLHTVSENVSDEQAVFVEPLAAACEILEQ